MESSPQRRCPHCGMPMAHRAETCLMCGAVLKERKRQAIRLPTGDLLLPLFLVVVVAVAWVWKPWLALPVKGVAGQVSVTVTPAVSAAPLPSATMTVAPTATPLDTPTPSPTPTLPPDQTVHTVVSGETVITIAKAYGTTASAVLKANNLKSTSIIKPGARLIIPLPKAVVPTATPTLVPSPTPLSYVVKSGDTLSTIAAKFDTTAAALMKANGITDATRIHAGARLLIVRPDELPVEPTAAPNQTYEVESGDTLFDIALEFKTTVADLKRANGLKSDMLHVGQKLTIPGGPPGSAPPPTATPQPTAAATSAPGVMPTDTETLSATTLAEPISDTMVSLVLPTWTPSLAAQGQAADLLAPADGAAFEGPDAMIRLIWASVGILDDDEWYVIRLRRGEAENKNISLYWTKATSFLVPPDAYVPGVAESQRWRWRVLVMRRTGADTEGNWTGAEIRPASVTRVFYWK